MTSSNPAASIEAVFAADGLESLAGRKMAAQDKENRLLMAEVAQEVENMERAQGVGGKDIRPWFAQYRSQVIEEEEEIWR